MNKKQLVLLLVILAIIIVGLFVARKNRQPIPSPTSSTTPSPMPSVSPNPIQNNLAEPVANFRDRITKKPFGIYVTPNNSPVQPERFTGYHTAIDIEYTDITEDIPVYAITDGTISLSRTASGYGGVFMMTVQINGKPHSVIYGHIRPSTLPKIGQEFKKGDKIAVLGTGYSKETDGERKHLHFGVLSDNRIDLLGYVPNRTRLNGWINPLSLY